MTLQQGIVHHLLHRQDPRHLQRRRHLHHRHPGPLQGEAMQVDPMKPTLKAPGTKRLKLKYDKLLSILLQFCFQFKLAPLQRGHRDPRGGTQARQRQAGKALHSSTVQLNLSRFHH